MFARSDVPVQAQWEVRSATNRAVAVVESGVNVIIDGMADVGSIDISADRLVLWTVGLPQARPGRRNLPARPNAAGSLHGGQHRLPPGRPGHQAQRMYYDVNCHIGLVLDAELLTPVPNYEGLLRLRAAIVRQTSQDKFFAEQGFFTSSRLGEPGYRMQASDIFLEDRQVPQVDPRTGNPVLDANLQPVLRHRHEGHRAERRGLRGRHPGLLLALHGQRPGRLALLHPPLPVRATTAFSAFRSKPVSTATSSWEFSDKPEGTDLELDLGYLSKRGFAEGGTFLYMLPDFLDVQGQTNGLLDFYGIPDHGTDNLGGNRAAMFRSPTSTTATASSGNTARPCPTISASSSRWASSATATSSRNTFSTNGTS